MTREEKKTLASSGLSLSSNIGSNPDFDPSNIINVLSKVTEKFHRFSDSLLRAVVSVELQEVEVAAALSQHNCSNSAKAASISVGFLQIWSQQRSTSCTVHMFPATWSSSQHVVVFWPRAAATDLLFILPFLVALEFFFFRHVASVFVSRKTCITFEYAANDASHS